MQMDFGLLTLAYFPLLLSPSFLCSIVSIAVPSQSCQLPSCDLFTSLALLSSFGRETSLVNITGPGPYFHHCLHPQFNFSSYFQLLLSLALIICKQQGRGIDNSSVLVGSKVICCCVQVHVNFLARSKLLARLSPTCISASPTGDKPWYVHRGKFATIYIQPSTWGNQRGELPLCIRRAALVAFDSPA